MYQVIIVNNEIKGKNYYYSYAESENTALGNISVEDLPPYQDINKARACYWTDGIWVYDPEEYEDILEQNTLALKPGLIAKSKTDLQEYIANNPLLSTAKHEEGRYYTVTQDKQQQLTSKLALYTMSTQMGQPYQLTWNDAGNECEPWTFEELSRLAAEMDAYITPLVSAQQRYEVQINNATTKAEMDAVTLDYGVAHA